MEVHFKEKGRTFLSLKNQCKQTQQNIPAGMSVGIYQDPYGTISLYGLLKYAYGGDLWKGRHNHWKSCN